jgi:hypothetical protein
MYGVLGCDLAAWVWRLGENAGGQTKDQAGLYGSLLISPAVKKTAFKIQFFLL